MENLKVDRTKLYTHKAYAEKIKTSLANVSQRVKRGTIKTVSINGGVLIYDD